MMYWLMGYSQNDKKEDYRSKIYLIYMYKKAQALRGSPLERGAGVCFAAK